MADYDGKIRVGFDLDTKDVLSKFDRDLNEIYSSLKKISYEIDKNKIKPKIDDSELIKYLDMLHVIRDYTALLWDKSGKGFNYSSYNYKDNTFFDGKPWQDVDLFRLSLEKLDSVSFDTIMKNASMVQSAFMKVQSSIARLSNNDPNYIFEEYFKNIDKQLDVGDYAKHVDNLVNSIGKVSNVNFQLVGETKTLYSAREELEKIDKLLPAIRQSSDLSELIVIDNNKIERKLNELKAQASKVKINLQFDFDKTKISNRLSEVKRAAEGIKFYVSTGNLVDARDNLESIKQEIDSLKSKRNELNEAFESGSIDKIKFIADTSEIDKTINELENTVIEVETEIKSSNNNISGLGSLTNKFNSIKEFAGKIGSKLSLVKMIASTTLSVFKKLLKVSDFFVDSLKKAYSRMKAVNEAIKGTIASFAKLTKGSLDFMHDMTSVIPVADKLKESLNNLGFGDLVGANLLADSIRSAVDALKEFGKSSVDEGSKFQSAYLRIKDTFGDARDEIYNFAKSSGEALGMSETAYMEAATKIGVFARSYISDTDELAKVTNALTMSIADLSAQTGFSIDETMQKVLSGLRGNTEAIEELGINVKVADMQNWLDTQGIDAKFENLNSNMQNLYRTWYMLDKVQSNGAMGYASKMMNTYSGQVRILQAQLSDLKTTIGTYLMQALVPVLKVVNVLLSRLIDLANMAGKAFGFKDKYSIADTIGTVDTSSMEGVYDGATDSLSKTVDKQNELSKATEKTAKEAKKALAPFHKLNILTKNDNSNSKLGNLSKPDVSIPGSDLKLSKSIDKKKAKEPVSEWIEAIKKAINDGNWFKVGQLLAQKVNELVQKAKELLLKIKPWLEKWARNLARVINGFVNDFNFANLGSTLAVGLDVITDTILNFTKSVQWDKIGSGLGTMFRIFMKETDWNNVGKLWTEKTRILIEILSGFVKKMSEIDLETGLSGFGEFGKSLANFVTGMIDNIPWGKLGSTISGALNGISDAIIEFTKEFNASEEFGKIVSGINTAIEEFDAFKFAKSASSLINEVLKALKTAVLETDWGTLGTKIGTAIFKTIADIKWDDVADTIEGALSGALDFAGNFVKQMSDKTKSIHDGIKKVLDKVINWLKNEDNKEAITSYVNRFVDNLIYIFGEQDWGGLYDALREIFKGIDWSKLAYLLNFPEVIASGLSSEHGLDVVIGAVGSLLKGILKIFLDFNPTLMFWNIGKSIIEGIVNGLTDNKLELPSVSGIFFGFIDWVKSIFKIESVSKVFEEIGNFLIDGLLNGIKEKWEEFKEFFTVKIPELISSVKEKFNGFKDAISEVWDKVKESTSNKWESLKEFFTVKIPELISHVKEKFSGFKDTISEVWEKVKEGTSTKWNEIKDTIVGVFNTIANGIKSPINTIISFIETMVNGVISGINAAIGALNRFSVEVPSWVPEYGGQKFGFNIPTLNNVSIPRLAQGAVIKPNQRFLAELGDQTRGVNIEAPLDTIKSGVRDVLGEFSGYNNGDLTAYIYLGNDLLEEKVVEIVKDNTFRSNGR